MNKKIKLALVTIFIIMILYAGICIYFSERDIKNNPPNNFTICGTQKELCNMDNFNFSNLTISIRNEVRTEINRNIDKINNINIT